MAGRFAWPMLRVAGVIRPCPEVGLKPTVDLLQAYELRLERLERLELASPGLKYVNRAVAVRSFEAWVATLNLPEKIHPSQAELPLNTLWQKGGST